MEGKKARFELVHAMRGVAALSVLLYHALYKAYLAQRPDNPLTPYAAHLDVGVSIFFLISGFVLYRPMVAARLAGEPPLDTEEYGRRRLRRIVPAYWVALVVAGLAGASYLGYPKIFSAQGIPAYFGFLQIYSPDTAGGGINVAWTLCVEITFYAFLPIWLLLLRRLVPRGGVRSEFVALAMLFAASIAWQLVAVRSTDVNMFGLSAARWIEPLPNFLDEFAVGMALAVASVAVERRRPARAWRWLLLAALAYIAMSMLVDVKALTPGTYLLRHQLNTIVALGLLVPAIFVAPGRRLLRLPALAFLGTVSYGIYLYHVPVMIRLGSWFGVPRSAAALALWLAVTVAVTVTLAALSWRFVERPLLGGQRRTVTGRPTLPASSTARTDTERALAPTGIA
jgi:peptidoglycan/LPS O-acetylase OafA/YrhL